MKETFWLLDVNYEVRNHKPEVWIWGINSKDERILVIDRNFVTYFYLVLDERENPQDILARITDLKGNFPFITNFELTSCKFFGKKVNAIKVYCQDPELISKYSKRLSKVKGVKRCLENDIRYSMRYLIDNDVVPCGWHQIEVEDIENSLEIQVDKVYLAKSIPRRITREDVPKLKVLGFSMICYSPRGAPKPDKNPIVIMSVATNYGDERQFTVKDSDDRELIESFIGYVKDFDPDIIVGYETNRKDWQYLLKRSRKLGIKLSVDRVGTEPHQSVYGHISITGRANIDLYDYADEFPEIKVKTLENVADYLGVMKLEKHTIIEEVDLAEYWEDDSKRQDLREFSIENTRCIMGIFEVIRDFALQLSNLVGLPLDQIGKAAVGFRVEWYLIRNAHKIDELVPDRRGRPYVRYAGGMVLAPKPGIHEKIAVLDFKAMYPNIMIENNISPDTYVSPSEPEPPSGTNTAPQVKHRFRREPLGFYSKVLSNLIHAREEVRRKLKTTDPKSREYRVLDARQKAVKVITNAMYGYAGWIGARWYIKPVAEATAAWGRNVIHNTIKMAEDLGLSVIYSDTDSIFIRYDSEKIDKLSKIIEEKFGLEIKPDKIYTRIFFTEAKKRYCGLQPDGQLDIVGLEVVRGDWAEVAKTIQERVLELILKERSPKKAVNFVRQYISNLREKKVPFRDLIIWKTLTKPIEDYAVNAPHIQAAKMLKKEGWELAVGYKVGYVITKGSGRLYERAKPYVFSSYDEVDTEYYVTKQVIPAALRVLSTFNIKEEDLLLPKTPKTLFEFLNGC